jgi:hypothetical protein
VVIPFARQAIVMAITARLEAASIPAWMLLRINRPPPAVDNMAGFPATGAGNAAVALERERTAGMIRIG